ncbi:hypothetical protein [Paracnuella aquatica]|uniref:hypothetical protein n=1 Tax=Paracnuella aquatica TaxID=2268757 RepID=UPI000DEF57CC|nr:hypothetical protein [Paracnuella aquatica]RPD44048.1 hypothetical protein DRJ53_18345 [Paracnuella aquatica]
MNKSILTSLLFLATTLCQAQTFDEWFRQKKTQKKYLIEQIVALNAYLGYVQKGYSIAQKGLNMIGSVKQGDYDLHKGFFLALSDINPNIGKYAKVADIVALQLKALQQYRNVTKQVKANGQFNGEEVDYINKVFSSVLEDCASIIIQLTDIITPSALEMKDDERLGRIDALYADMQEAYTFAQSFGAEVNLLGVQRIKEKAAIQTSRVLHDLKKQ